MDENADGTVDSVHEQSEDSFIEQISSYKTKRALGSNYKMNSGTWTQEMDIYEKFFAGKTTSEIETLVKDLFSDLNGRPLNGNSTKDDDIKKAEGLSDDQKAVIDSLAGATMSVNDAHGNLIKALVKSYEAAK